VTAFPSSHYRVGRLGAVDLAVLHTAEVTVDRFHLARSMAASSRLVSCHSIVDDLGRLDVLPFTDTAYAAPGANADGDQLELCGLASWDRATWLNRHHGMVDQAARWAAERCRARGLPPVILTPEQLRADRRGITTHAAVSAAFHRSTHTDPGKGFPLDVFLGLVKDHLTVARPGPAPPAVRVAPPWPGVVLRVGSSGTAVSTWQRQMRRRGWTIVVDGRFGPASAKVASAFQADKHLHVDGRVGRDTWRATWAAPVT
jgi:hypothetical protein